MPKNAQARIDKSEIVPIMQFVQRLMKADAILGRTIALEDGIEPLEARKAALAQETADLIAKTEAARQEHAATMAATAREIDALRAQRQAEQDGLRADQAARAKAAEDDARVVKKRLEDLAVPLRQENERLRAENAELRRQRAALQEDLDSTLGKYAALRK